MTSGRRASSAFPTGSHRSHHGSFETSFSMSASVRSSVSPARRASRTADLTSEGTRAGAGVMRTSFRLRVRTGSRGTGGATSHLRTVERIHSWKGRFGVMGFLKGIWGVSLGHAEERGDHRGVERASDARRTRARSHRSASARNGAKEPTGRGVASGGVLRLEGAGDGFEVPEMLLLVLDVKAVE